VGDFLDDVTPEQGVVIDDAGRQAATVWGDIMTVVTAREEIGGTILDGACREVPRIRALRHPVFIRRVSMITGKDRVEVDAFNGPVCIASEHVAPGDLMPADDTAVIRTPRSGIDEVLSVAEDISRTGSRIPEALGAEMTPCEARRRFGYHSLETRG
jgi:regulator of RNase E activity RraA